MPRRLLVSLPYGFRRTVVFTDRRNPGAASGYEADNAGPGDYGRTCLSQPTGGSNRLTTLRQYDQPTRPVSCPEETTETISYVLDSSVLATDGSDADLAPTAGNRPTFVALREIRYIWRQIFTKVKQRSLAIIYI